jgi:hypothetical protein
VLAADQTTSEVGIAGQLEQRPRHDGGVREVGEDPVHAELIELKVLVHRIAGVVGDQTLLLVRLRSVSAALAAAACPAY